MKIVFVGGGSYRTLPIVRAAMAHKKIFHQGEIRLVDFNLERVETVARMIMKTPEYAHTDCKVTWTNCLERALPGTDMVSISFPVGSQKAGGLSAQACAEWGFFGSDQISMSGAFLAVTGGTIVLGIARQMEKHCPKAWLVDFANPVAVYSGMVNNHTKVRALGICGGFANHRWDLTRLLFDRDEYCDEFKVVSAGVNHLSFILRGTYHGKDIYRMLDQRTARKGWKPCQIQTVPHGEENIRYALERLVEMRRRFGQIIFSTENDGMMHIFYQEMHARMMKGYRPMTRAGIERRVKRNALMREQTDREFRGHLDRELDARFWAQNNLKNPHFAANPADATVVVLKALGGVSRQWLAASRPNRGAVKGFKDRTVLEYSMFMDQNGIHPESNLEVPDCFHGLISSLATHQTLVGDAIATRDPRIFANALYAYPIYQNTREAKALWRELLKIHAAEMPKEFQRARDYF